ncbi:hypothetical protein QNH26_22310 [Peribacillus frigoritolerans]|uniref:hypothetical protein n=1 Tax=Peribacillus frigoritolerans TaxID=450367 RepID=UPI0024C0F110|nr:hypothetical protein [Peribacillus frigoritolerans]WHX66357.1 hypothetical protein QNH26_22310 [Peribacillus frigoritolerans]
MLIFEQKKDHNFCGLCFSLLLYDRIAKIEGGKNEFKRFQAPVLTLNNEEDEDIFDNLIHLFDGVVVEGEIQEVKEEEPIDQLKR